MNKNEQAFIEGIKMLEELRMKIKKRSMKRLEKLNEWKIEYMREEK